QPPQIRHQGSKLHDPRPPTQPLHALLLLPPRRNLGPMMMRVASFFPFQTTYYLNGHSFIEQELKRAQIGFRKTDNAFLAVADVAALQAAADRLSPAIIRGRLDYWTLILGPKFSTKERKQLSHAFMRSPRSSIAATSSSSATFPSTPSTNCSS